MYALITIVGIVVTVFFLLGFGRGLKNAIAEYRPARPSPTWCRTIGMAASRPCRSWRPRSSSRAPASARP